MRTYRTTAVLGVALVAFLIAPASAHRQTKTDPNDTDGALDIRSVSFAHTDGRFKVKVTTFGGWTIGDLQSGDSPPDNQFLFSLDTRGNSDTDFDVLIDALDGNMVAVIYRDNELVARFPASKNGKTAGASFRKGRVDPRSSYVRWGAASRSAGDRVGCNSGFCLDRVPGSGFYTHDLQD